MSLDQHDERGTPGTGSGRATGPALPRPGVTGGVAGRAAGGTAGGRATSPVVAPAPRSPLLRPLAAPLVPGGRPASVPPAARHAPASPPSDSSILFAAIPPVDEKGYELLTREVRSLLGFDLAQYKAPQVWRRVNGFATIHGFNDVASLLARCRTDAPLRTAFRDMITINVSEFFRNADAWQTLSNTVLPDLLVSRTNFRAWSAGCSLGYEPVSLAIALREAHASLTVRILATDIDETILAQARSGRYTDAQMLGVSPARRARFFRQDGDAWEVRPEIRALVTYRRHDLLRDQAETGFDLVVCRNVVIYFTEAAKASLYQRFGSALRRDGVLFIGATESIPNPRDVGLAPISPGFYRRLG